MEIIFKELEIDPTKLNPTEKVITLYDDIRKEILKMLSLHKHIKKRKEEIKQLDERLKDLEDFTKIVTINQPVVVRPPQIRPQAQVINQPASNPPQIRPQPQPQVVQDQPMLAVPQQPTKPKSPSKDSRSGAKPSGKRKGGAGANQGTATKRQRNA